MSETIRLFVGADGSNCDLESQMVLEYSARKHCSLPLSITWMQQAATGPWSGWRCGNGRTPFTHFRWSVPSVCGWQGQAIYTDSDFLFVADLAELWTQPIPHVALIRNPQDKPQRAACILFDCAKAKGHVPDLPRLRQLPDAHDTVCQYFRLHRDLLDPFEGNWDCIAFEKNKKGDGKLDDPRIKAIHYTRMEQQLHLKHAMPRLAREGRVHWYPASGAHVFEHPHRGLQALFDQLYAEALEAGYTVDSYRVGDFAIARKDFAYKRQVAS